MDPPGLSKNTAARLAAAPYHRLRNDFGNKHLVRIPGQKMLEKFFEGGQFFAVSSHSFFSRIMRCG